MGYVYLFFSVAIVYIILAVQILSRDRNEKLNKLFYKITMLFCFWSLMNGILFLVTDIDIAVEVRRFGVISWGSIYSLILSFVLIMTGFDKKVNVHLRYCILYIPVVVNWYLYFVLHVTADELMLTSRGWVLREYFSRSFIWNNFFYIYYVTFTTAAAVLLLVWLRKETVKRKRLQGKVIVSTLIAAFVLGTLLEVVLPINGINIFSGVTTIVAFIPIAGIWFSMVRYGFMSFKADRLAVDVLELMGEGLIICDNEGKIKNINDGGKKMLSCTDNCFTNIYQLFPDLSINVRVSSFEEEITTKLNTHLSIVMTTQPLYDMLNEHYGTLIVFQDISRVKRAEKELIGINENLESLVANRTKNLIVLNNDLLTEMDARKSANEKVKHMAFHDYMTGLPNMRLFKRTLKRMIGHHEKIALLFIDLTAFKTINDVLGHAKGDVLIKGVAHRFNAQLEMDEFIARTGGDEFLYTLPYETIDYLENRINEILNMFEKPFILNTQDIYVAIGIGVSLYPDHSDKTDELLKLSGIAMTEAKAKGKNCFSIFDEKMKEKLDTEIQLTNDLYEVVSDKPFELYYQPQIDSVTNKVTGAEALIRWIHPKHGMISPNLFIPLIEKNGMMLDVGNWVIEEAFKQQKKWVENHDFDIIVSVNLSGHQLTSKQFQDYIESLSKNPYYDFTKIEFEVTESTFLRQWDVALETLEKLHELGASIAIDDFGVDYSSLRYIKNMPLTTLKIDKSFVDGIGINIKDEAIIQTIITLAKSLNMNLVAEGVESKHQIEFLDKHACHTIQGYYYSKPLSVLEFNKFINQI